MRHLIIALVLNALALVCGCSDDSSTPQDEHPATRFSRLLGSYGQHTRMYDVLVMSDGTRVVVGTFRGVLHITGSVDSVAATTTDDFFLAGFRPDGSVEWKRTFASGNLQTCKIARDGADNFYLAGYYGGNTNVGGTSLTGYGLTDAMIARLDKNGDPVWVQGTGTTDNDFARDIVTASDAGVFVCGTAGDEMTIAGEDLGQVGKTTGYLVKVRPDGVGNWAATAYTTVQSTCDAVARAANGDVLVAGSYGGTVDIGGEILPAGTGSLSAFMARFTAAGTPVRNVRMASLSTGYVLPSGIMHANGKIVVIGEFTGTADFEVNTGAGEYTSAGGTNSFVALYNDDGSFQWARQFGSGDIAYIAAIAYTGSDLVIAGWFEGSLTFDATTLTSDGLTDAFVARLNLGGDVTSARKMGSFATEYVYGLAASGGRPILIGTTMDNITFPNGDIRKPYGDEDGFVYQD